MDAVIGPTARRELQKCLTHCGAARLKLEALQAAGLPVDDELRQVDAVQQRAEGLLALDTPAPVKR